jgi:branched-chain amino acid transport system substrate-binding protein
MFEMHISAWDKNKSGRKYFSMKRISNKIFTAFALCVLIVTFFSFVGCKKGAKVLKVCGIVRSGIIGEGQKNGIELAVEEINKAGGVLGKKIRMYWVTEGKDSSQLKNDITQAIERDGCSMLVGGFSSGSVFVAMSVMKEKKVLWFGTGGAHTSIINAVEKDPGMRYYVRVGTLDSSTQGGSIAKFARDVIKPKGLLKVAYIRTNLPYSHAIIKTAREDMESYGFKTVIKDEAVSINASDFSAFFAQCKAKGVQVIVNCLLFDEGVNLQKQFGALGLNKKIALIGSLAAGIKDEFGMEVGPANAAYMTTLTASTGPVDMTGDNAAPIFAKKYMEKFGKSAYWQAYITYDAMKIIKDVVEKTKSFNANKILDLIESPDYEFKGLALYKWHKKNHDLYSGLINGKHYADHPHFQFFPDGKRYCVYPPDWKQKEYLAPGQSAE